MDLEYAINLCLSINECEVGNIKKQAIRRVIDELKKYMEDD